MNPNPEQYGAQDNMRAEIESDPKIIVNSIGIFDIEELHTNCTVQILRNSITGEESIGWWDNEEQT